MNRFRAFLAASPWVVQTAILIGIYVAVMAIATLWMPWHAWDMNLFASMSASQTATLDPRIVVVDVQSYSETENTSPQRSTVAAFLSKLASKPPAQHPTAVILDFNFGPCDLCARATAVLESSLLAARAANINVYAVEALPVDQNDVPGSLETHDPDIYEGYRYLAGFGHTTFVVADSGVLISRDCYAAVSYHAPNSDTAVTQPLESIITLVSTGFDGSNARQATLPCNTQQGAVYVGPSLTRSPYSTLPRDQFYPVTLAHSFPDVASLKGDYVIVGSVEHDQPIYESNIPDTQAAWQRLHGDGSVDIGGPELVAWALSDDLDASAMRGTQAVNGMLLFLVAAFSGVTALAFAACFLLLRRLQLRSARRFLPWIAAALACCIGLVVFAAFEALMLGLGKVQPQVSLISFAVLLSAGLSGVRGNQITGAAQPLIPPSEDQPQDYDVFISYAHDEGAWVSENVCLPFREARLPDGRKLSIFFDTSSLQVGQAFQDKLSLGVDGSRVIVPVYSDIYFQRPYCIFELRRAYGKWISLGAQSRCLLPIMRGHPNIPQAFADIQAISVDDQPDIVQRIVAEVVERLAQQHTAARTEPAAQGGSKPSGEEAPKPPEVRP
jgi:hypothetical protein